MQYNGGKSRIAKYIAPIVNAERAGRVLWEPFCGGLSMTVELAKMPGPFVASDSHAGLIALYEIVRADPTYLDGFDCSEQDYAAAKTLPNNHPAKAFVGFGCSFGGKWFGGYGRRSIRSLSLCAADLLKKRINSTRDVLLQSGSFFEVEPRGGMVLYCDPPYAGTTGFSAVGRFDSPLFFDRCREWSNAGSVVFISEYAAPVGVVVWSRKSTTTLGAGIQNGKEHEERLYRL